MKPNADWLVDGPARSKTTFVFAHGAGASMDTDFMNDIAEAIAAAGIRVVRFEFPYMAQRRATGKRRPPDRPAVLLETYTSVVRQVDGDRIIIGGKSMGGRIASLLADELNASGLICLGYPFHPAGKPDQLRIDHLKPLTTPTLILQGERDPMGRREEVEEYDLSETIQLQWLTDGDHSFKPRKASGLTAQQNWQQAAERSISFIKSL